MEKLMKETMKTQPSEKLNKWVPRDLVPGIILSSIVTEPELGRSINESMFKSVDFPDPDGPMSE